MTIRVSDPEESGAATVAPDRTVADAAAMTSHVMSDDEAKTPRQPLWPALVIGLAIIATLAWNGMLLWLLSRMLFF